MIFSQENALINFENWHKKVIFLAESVLILISLFYFIWILQYGWIAKLTSFTLQFHIDFFL